MILLGLLLALLGALYYYLNNVNNYWNKRGVPGVKPSLLFGNLRENFFRSKSFGDVLDDLYNFCKDRNLRYCGMFQLTTPILLISDPELIKQITIKDFDHFVDHQNHSREEVDRLFSKNLFSIRGEKWRDMRATLSPAFTGSKMRGMFYLINDCVKRFVEHYSKYNEEVIKLDLKDAFTRITNDAIASCAFGLTCNSIDDRNNDFYTLGKKTFDFTGFRGLIFFMYNSCPKLLQLLGIKFFNEDIATFFTNIIKETIQMREGKGLIRPDIIHLMLQARKGKLNNEDEPKVESGFSSSEDYHVGLSKPGKMPYLTDEDITAQALIFYFGGFDTTSYLMGYIALELALNKEIQDRLRMEIEETFPDWNGELKYEDIMKMKYLDMVVSEALRKWPLSTLLDRLCTKEYTIKAKRAGEKDLIIKKDEVLWIPTYGLHRDPDNYPDPEKFDPERFSAENKSKIKPFTYLPFGEGPRNCIGSRFALMENKAVIVHILKHFEIVPTEKTDRSLKLSVEQVLLAPKGGFHVGLKKL